MPLQRQYYSESPEGLLVGLARKGERPAFEELVGRRQTWIRNLMRRFCGDVTLADDLSQQVFLQAWRSIHNLRQTSRFGPWLKQLSVNTWLQHVRKNDPLRNADEVEELGAAKQDTAGITMDLDQALAALSTDVRVCIVLSYHEGMTHEEIADFIGTPLGTVKSHIRRGTQRLQQILSAYRDTADTEQ